MFTPQMLEKIPIELEKLYSQLEIEVMLDIIRRIKETASITRTADYQINRLYHLGVSKRNIKKLIKSILNLSQKEINRIYKDAIKTGYVEDEKLYKSLGKKQIQFEKNIELQQMISSIQEQTLTFVPKVLAIVGALLLFGPWMMTVLASFITELFSNMNTF